MHHFSGGYKPSRGRRRGLNSISGRRLLLEPLEDRRLLAVLFRVNAGGPELAGAPAWTSDALAAPSIYNNAASGGNSGANSTAATINMTHSSLPPGTPMALFQSQRFDKPSGANMLWDFPVAAGRYEVRLYFAETNSAAFVVGGRQFDVTIEGVRVLDDYDIFADVGARKGVMKSFVVTADANIDIDFFRVKEDPSIRGIEILTVDDPPPPPGGAAAKIEVFPTGSIHNSSTATANSFRFYNNSAGGREIASVTIDLRTSLLPDVVYDPNGTGGDVVGIPFTPNSGAAATGQSSHAFSSPHDGGFDVLTVNFTDFDPGEMFSFRVDIDPTSVKGAAQPGPDHAASISGLELSGATVTFRFTDNSILMGQLFALEEGAPFYKVHSELVLTAETPPPTPIISLVGVQTPAIVQSAQQTVRVTGLPGSTVRLLQTEVALYLAGVPGGGFDVDYFEGNKVVVVKDSTAVIGAGGFVNIPVTLTDTLTAGGITYLAAVVDAGPRTGGMSNIIKVALNNLPPGSNTSALMLTGLAGDFDNDSDVDGADLLLWQRGPAAADDLEDWQANFGASLNEAGAVTAVSFSPAAPLAAPRLHQPTRAGYATFLQSLGAAPHCNLVDEAFDELGGRLSRIGKLRKHSPA
jgi:hypothetical protein